MARYRKARQVNANCAAVPEYRVGSRDQARPCAINGQTIFIK